MMRSIYTRLFSTGVRLHYRCIQTPYLRHPILEYDATDFDKSAGFGCQTFTSLDLIGNSKAGIQESKDNAAACPSCLWDEAEVDEWIKSPNKDFGPVPSRSVKVAEGKSFSKCSSLQDRAWSRLRKNDTLRTPEVENSSEAPERSD